MCDRQTDRQTDGQTERASARTRVGWLDEALIDRCALKYSRRHQQRYHTGNGRLSGGSGGAARGSQRPRT